MKRRIMTGTVGVVLALVWAMAFLYQRHNVSSLMSIAAADAPIPFRLSSLWSVLQIWIPALLVGPVVVMSVGTMVGNRFLTRVLRIPVAVTAVLSAGLLLIALATPGVAFGGHHLLANPRLFYELLVAGGTLGLQIIILILGGRHDRHEAQMAVGVTSDESQNPDKPPQPTSRDTQRAALPASAGAARA